MVTTHKRIYSLRRLTCGQQILTWAVTFDYFVTVIVVKISDEMAKKVRRLHPQLLLLKRQIPILSKN